MKFGSRFISIACPCAIAGLTALSFSTIFSSGAIAQDAFPTVGGVPFGQVYNEFTEAYFGHDRNFYRNRSFTGQLKWIFGPFPENSMARDGKDINRVYNQTMYRQLNAGPIVRTLDLPSPFSSSLRTLPPPAPVAIPVQAVEPPLFTPPPMARPLPPAPAEPVPALW